MAKREEKEYDFLGLYIEEKGGKEEKSNGAIKLKEDNIFIEKKSRLNGKIKDSFEISYGDLDSENIDRAAKNKIVIQWNDKNISLKTIDYEMLDKFEDKLFEIIGEPSFIEESESVTVNKINAKISEIDIPDQIRKYHDLYKEGIITEEEFEHKKEELLNS